MKRSQILAAAGAAAALILLVLTLRQVSALRVEVNGLRDRLLQMEQSLTDEISGIDNAVRRELRPREACSPLLTPPWTTGTGPWYSPRLYYPKRWGRTRPSPSPRAG